MARGLGGVPPFYALLDAMPCIAILGAILLTGYLGGAVSTHLSASSPVSSRLLCGVSVGLLLWAGLRLREPRLCRPMPFRL